MLEKTPFRTEVHGIAPGTSLLTLSGDLDYDTAAELFTLARDLFAGDVRHLDLDLSGLDFIDSSGVAALINVYNAAGEHDATMRIVALTSYLRHLFRVTALDQVFALPPKEE
ncbi:anti-sigma B factor antagonist [Streptosporangium becharense]|uniref:Anti-sigma factor antagonist n=1 Tax=Streptosporangium becharense TaxID=1816182 RepID=A0A7W9MKM4_9ACTN|nr:STAS domain-containing protein [Streptosporangium becharense]MBB2914274.1 anti-sigma B factor antagonist [Streptosporangium becharense]MBB5823694.1 anti-sigma B factor antagonist [Streptosporangium becharense]